MLNLGGVKPVYGILLGILKGNLIPWVRASAGGLAKKRDGTRYQEHYHYSKGFPFHTSGASCLIVSLHAMFTNEKDGEGSSIPRWIKEDL